MKKIRLGKRGGSYILEDDNGNHHYQCSKCKEIKLLNDQNFYKQNIKKSGFRGTCKQCCDKYIMNRYHNDEEVLHYVPENLITKIMKNQKRVPENLITKIMKNQKREREKVH
jgi:hypothetical protein